jgi:hypothetical protein
VRTILLIGLLSLLIFAGAVAVGRPGIEQPAELSPAPPFADDEPIIIADTHTIPIETEGNAPASTPKSPRYRFIYNAYFKVDAQGKKDKIYDGTHQIGAAFVCLKDLSGNYFPIRAVDLGQDKGEVDFWDAGVSRKVKLKWENKSQIDIDRGGHAHLSVPYPSSGLDFDYAIRQVRWVSLSHEADYQRSNTTDDIDSRLVIHYCVTPDNCTVKYAQDHDPCASSLPPTVKVQAPRSR